MPAQNPDRGKPLDFEYRLIWQKETERRPPLMWVMQTRRGRGYLPKPDNRVAFVIDFVGAHLALPPQADIGVDSNGELLESRLEPNPASGGWRLFLDLRRLAADKPVELRARLQSDKQVLSETWSYILPPE